MRFINVILFLNVLTNAQAQTTEDLHLEKKAFYLNILDPGADFEIRATKRTTLNLKLAASPLLGFASRDILVPYSNLQYRYYLKLKSETLSGTSLIGNSGNYLDGIIESYLYSEDKPTKYHTASLIGIGYGAQRIFQSHFRYFLEIGLGNYIQGSVKVKISPIGNVGLGYLIR